MESLLTRIDHVGIAVPDLDEAIAFYGRAFGLSVVHEEVNEKQGVREAMLGVGDSGSCIQLLAPLNADSTIAKFLDRSGPGIQRPIASAGGASRASATIGRRSSSGPKRFAITPRTSRSTSSTSAASISGSSKTACSRSSRRSGSTAASTAWASGRHATSRFESDVS